MLIKTEDLKHPDIELYTTLKQAQLFHYFEPEPGIFIAESPKVIQRALEKGYEPLSFLLCEGQALTQSSEILQAYSNIPAYVVSEEEFQKLSGATLTRGALCAMRRKLLPSAKTVLEEVERKTGNRKKRIGVLEDVVNPTNVGAIMRNAAALGLDALFLTKGCADPLQKRALRVSMGCALQMTWTYMERESYIKQLQSFGYKTVAMALLENTLDICDERFDKEERLAIVLGTEGEGLCESSLSETDYTVCIPMENGVDSLNVAAASAIAFWQLGRKV